MTKSPHLFCALAALLFTTAAVARPPKLWVIEPMEGRETVKPMVPDWCHDRKPSDKPHSAENQLDRLIEQLKREERVPINWLGNVAGLACDFPEDAAIQQQVAYWRQDWVNFTGITEAEDREQLKVRMDPRKKDWYAEMCKQLMIPEDSPPSFETKHAQSIAYALGCGKWYLPGWLPDDLLYWFDRPDRQISEVVRANYVIACLPEQGPKRSNFPHSIHRSVTGEPYSLAQCGIDARRLDRKALDAEVERLKLNPLGKVLAIEVFSAAQARAKDAERWVEKEAKRTPRIKQLLVDIPEAAFKQWDQLYADNKAAFDEANRIEDTVFAIEPSKRADRNVTKLELGCEKLRTAWQSYVTGKKPRRVEDIVVATNDAVAGALLDRLVLCDSLEQRWLDAGVEELLLKRSGKQRRGPRFHALNEIWAEGHFKTPEMQAKNSGVPGSISMGVQSLLREMPNPVLKATLHRNAYRDLTVMFEAPDARKYYATPGQRNDLMEMAKVAAVKPAANEMLEITFVNESWMEEDRECKDAIPLRIWSWENDGRPMYEKTCKVTGHHKETFNLSPRLVSSVYGAAVKKGQLIRLVVDNGVPPAGKLPLATVVEIDEPPKGKGEATPLTYLGIKFAKGK